MTEPELLVLIGNVIQWPSTGDRTAAKLTEPPSDEMVADQAKEILELVRQHDESDGDSEARRSEALERAVQYYQIVGGPQAGGFKALLNTAETFEDWLAGRVAAEKVR